MRNATELDAFIRAAKEQGATDEFLVAMLHEKGWPAKDVYRLLARRYTDSTGVAIPEPPSRLESAREAFFHLLAFATLGTWVFAIGSIWFSLTAIWFPDATLDRPYDFSIGQISWQLASIIVAFPAFVWATRSILGDLLENPDKAESPIRRWITNIGLLLTALVFIGDLVTFVTSLLRGGLTIRFALNCLVAFVLAGSVFLYYSHALGKSRRLPPLIWHRVFATAAGGVILVTLGFGFWLNGSPFDVRVLNEDNRRLQNLYDMASQINFMTNESGTSSPPTNLQALTVVKSDPFTGQAYEYHVLEGIRYQLCAQFGAVSKTSSDRAAQFWFHPAGHKCFDLQTSSAPLYPPRYFR